MMTHKWKPNSKLLVKIHDHLFKKWVTEEKLTIPNVFYIHSFDPDSAYQFSLKNIEDQEIPWLVDPDEFTLLT